MGRKKGMKWLINTSFILAGVGGLVHVLSSYNFYNLLGVFGTWSPIVQLVAGLGGVYVAVTKFIKR